MNTDILHVQTSIQTVLREAYKVLERLYGDRLIKVILYGSYARGEAQEDSDLDLLIVLQEPFHLYEEIKRTSPLVMDVLLQYKIPLSLLYVSEARYHDAFHPLMININKEGIEL